MAASLDAIAANFDRLEKRPAVFDREIREQVGLWRSPEPVSIEEIIGEFKTHGAFTVDDTHVYLPLHEEDSPNLTGEYVVYRPDQLVTSVIYYDYAKGDLARIPIEDFGETYPAWRLRFWHPEHDTNGAFASNSSADDVLSSDSSQPTSSEPVPQDQGASPPNRPLEIGEDGDIFEELRLFIQREREAEREAARQRFDQLDIDQYTNGAGGIPHLVSAGLHVDSYGQQAVRLRISPDEIPEGESVDIPSDYQLYPGTEVLVDTRTPSEGFPVEAEILDIDGRQLDIGVYWNRSSAKGKAESVFKDGADRGFVIGELLNPVPSDRELDGVNEIENHDRKRLILTGEATPEFDSALETDLSKAGLNTHQYRAAEKSLQADDVYCIHGPPGTGKTRTLIKILRTASAKTNRILACADSNQAVDNLLIGDSTPDNPDPRSLHGIAQKEGLDVVRVGSNSDNQLVADEYVGGDVWRADVVCATTSGAHQFDEGMFDLAVLDEATQATVPSSLIPFAKADRLILAGDHKQLPPYHSSEGHDEESLEISLFEHLLAKYGEEISTTLRTQYRMNASIAAFPNEEFYGGELATGDQNAEWTLGEMPPLEAIQVNGEEETTPTHSYYNELEAKAVARQVSNALHSGAAPGDIGIITPYSGQIGVIRRYLANLDDPNILSKVKIATIDSFQGSEREMIIISFVRSNPQGFSGFLTFPNEGPRRLNVALTRARRRCVLVGNFETLRTLSPTKNSEESSAMVYQRLYEHLQANGHLHEHTP